MLSDEVWSKLSVQTSSQGFLNHLSVKCRHLNHSRFIKTHTFVVEICHIFTHLSSCLNHFSLSFMTRLNEGGLTVDLLEGSFHVVLTNRVWHCAQQQLCSHLDRAGKTKSLTNISVGLQEVKNQHHLSDQMESKIRKQEKKILIRIIHKEIHLGEVSLKTLIEDGYISSDCFSEYWWLWRTADDKSCQAAVVRVSKSVQTNTQATWRTMTLRIFWNKAHSDDIQRRCTRRGLWLELELYKPPGTDRSRSDPDTLEMPNKGCMDYMGDPTAITTEELKVMITRATWGPRTPEPCHQWISPAQTQLQHRPHKHKKVLLKQHLTKHAAYMARKAPQIRKILNRWTTTVKVSSTWSKPRRFASGLGPSSKSWQELDYNYWRDDDHELDWSTPD